MDDIKTLIEDLRSCSRAPRIRAIVIQAADTIENLCKEVDALQHIAERQSLLNAQMTEEILKKDAEISKLEDQKTMQMLLDAAIEGQHTLQEALAKTLAENETLRSALRQMDDDCRNCAHMGKPVPCECEDADYLCHECEHDECICKECWDNSKWEWKGLEAADLDRQPTVDAVPVVRCKDCKAWTCFMNNPDGTMFGNCELCGNNFRNEDDFCSYGERRGE